MIITDQDSLKNKLNISHVIGGLLLVALVLLYLFTLDNGLRPDELTGGDLITHQYAQVEARPGNAPGYPFYTMGGWLWFRIGNRLLNQVLNPTQILSLYSTLWGLASLAVLYLILLKVAGRQWPIALLLTAFYAVTFFFWYYSVTTEQYTSAVFQTLLVIWLAFRWDDSPRNSILLWLAFICGTMLANMVTTLFILPPLLWFLLFRREKSGLMLFHYLSRPRLILGAFLAALLPLLTYGYVYIRGAQHPEWRGAGQWPTAWVWFVDFITIQQGRDELAPGLTLQTFFTAEFPALMGQELTWLLFFGGLAGLACLGRRRAIFLYSTLFIYLIFCWAYRFGNWFQVIIPAYPIFIIGFAAGLASLSRWAGSRLAGTNLSRISLLALQTLIFLLLTGLLSYRFVASLPGANQRNLPGDTGLEPGWAILADRPVSPARIVTVFEERVALQYLRLVWSAGQGIIPLDVGSLENIEELDRNAPALYISRQAALAAPNLVNLDHIYPQAAGEQLIRLAPTPAEALPPSASSITLEFGDRVQLVGWERLKSDPLSSGSLHQQTPRWKLALYWQTLAPLTEDYTISVRPLANGQLIMDGQEAVIQDHQPVWGFYPTSRWQPDVLVRDVYALTLPETAGAPDAVQIIVYKATTDSFENVAEHTLDFQ